MFTRLLLLVLLLLALGQVPVPVRAGQNASANVEMIPVTTMADTLAYRISVNESSDVIVVHMEFSYDSEALEVVGWDDADVHRGKNLRIGPKLKPGQGRAILAIYSAEFRVLEAFSVGVITFRKRLVTDAVPSLWALSLVDSRKQEDWIISPQVPLRPVAPADDDGTYPVRFALAAASPNPMVRETTMKYEIPHPGSHVTITVYDVTGRVTRTLVDEHRIPGLYSETWDLANDHGQLVAPGVYFCRMEAGSFKDTKKLVLLR
jgi:hypothetical protein